MKVLLLIFILIVCASCQTTLPSYLKWDYNYSLNAPEHQDPAVIMFDVFVGPSLADTSYALLDSTQTRELRLLSYAELYNQDTHYFFLRARSLIGSAVSLPSDTVYDFFSEILAGEPYNIKILETKIPQ